MTACAQSWPGYARDPQHSTLSTTPSQLPQLVRWSTPVDLDPQYRGSDLLIHYGTPVITAANTVIVPVKTGASGGFRLEAHNASDGALLWTQSSDYTLPEHNWTPAYGVTLTPNDGEIVFPGAGGTIYLRSSPNSSGLVNQLAFYGMANYTADPAAFNAAIQICTPISSDSDGNLYFGYVSNGAPVPGYASGLPSGLARIPKFPDGSYGPGSFVSAASMCGDNSMTKVCLNCAPALSNDGSTLYIAVNDGSNGYLCALNSTTLARQSSVLLRDPKSSSPAWLSDDSSASPTVGPDGDVYYGVLENPFPSNNDRGWLLHFSGDLGTAKIPGAFGWDDTASVVPASAVPSYTGSATYLLLTKYNNYAGIGSGDGINRLALVDPTTSFEDPTTGATVMNPFITVKGVTPDAENVTTYPNAVREWCINSAAVDPINRCAVVNSEDGNLYRWDFTKPTDSPGQLSPALYLAPPTGEAYTPTSIGPDGSVYAINNATLFSIDPKLGQAVLDNINHVLTFTYLRALADTTYTVQTSTDLADLQGWTATGVNQGGGGVGQIVTASISIGTETKRFVRLEQTTNSSANRARPQNRTFRTRRSQSGNNSKRSSS